MYSPNGLRNTFFFINFGSTKELHAFLDVNIIDDGSRRRERYNILYIYVMHAEKKTYNKQYYI